MNFVGMLGSNSRQEAPCAFSMSGLPSLHGSRMSTSVGSLNLRTSHHLTWNRDLYTFGLAPVTSTLFPCGSYFLAVCTYMYGSTLKCKSYYLASAIQSPFLLPGDVHSFPSPQNQFSPLFVLCYVSKLLLFGLSFPCWRQHLTFFPHRTHARTH